VSELTKTPDADKILAVDSNVNKQDQTNKIKQRSTGDVKPISWKPQIKQRFES